MIYNHHSNGLTLNQTHNIMKSIIGFGPFCRIIGKTVKIRHSPATVTENESLTSAIGRPGG